MWESNHDLRQWPVQVRQQWPGPGGPYLLHTTKHCFPGRFHIPERIGRRAMSGGRQHFSCFPGNSGTLTRKTSLDLMKVKLKMWIFTLETNCPRTTTPPPTDIIACTYLGISKGLSAKTLWGKLVRLCRTSRINKRTNRLPPKMSYIPREMLSSIDIFIRVPIRQQEEEAKSHRPTAGARRRGAQ
jgi:hypothetical protein